MYTTSGPNSASNDQPAPTEQEKEPMLLLDTTGSMNYGTSENDPTPRKDTIREAISIIVARLAAADSQAAREEEGGGLRTVTFADGRAFDIGDLNPNNLQQKWSQIRWAGGTRIMPGFNQLLKTYTDEFGSEPAAERPLLLALVITDGEADDTDTFQSTVARAAGNMYVVLAIIGYGPEHDRALRAYQQVEAQNAHVKVMSFGGETDPEKIANALFHMIE
ncbi:MAG TPA: vWA domain-containing protein [Ktedonobacteraceae bacterium]|nr:vWA domain-containing protein [Ktedonobacteraceae bacterium]